MKYLFDTDICIYLFRGTYPEIEMKFEQCREGDIVVSSITASELWRGVAMASSMEKEKTYRKHLNILFESVPVIAYDEQAAIDYGKLSTISSSKKNAFDRMIAAHAIALDIQLITNNLKDYLPFTHHGLKVDNWVKS